MDQISPLPKPSSSKRVTTNVLPPAEGTPSFIIAPGQKSYKHQYSQIYYMRLLELKPRVEERALKRWKDIEGSPTLVPRVLEVTKGKLCYIIGTVYMDMPLKPNVMEDIAKDRSIPPPPPAEKFYSPDDKVMLEDESGRIPLVGDIIQKANLVTGVILGALGMETPNSEFEVIDVVYAGASPSKSKKEPVEDRMNVDDSTSSDSDEWIAAISGLEVGSPHSSDALIHMLVEYLAGEECGIKHSVSATQISRLIVAGNSLTPLVVNNKGEATVEETTDKKPRKYGHDTTTFSTHPIFSLSAHLLDIGQAIPIHVLPGETDPSGVILPQQALPRGMFGAVGSLSSFHSETNPTYLHLGAETSKRTLLVNSGQPLNDMFKYVSCPPHTRLSLLESTLAWRHMAPTAPDTLWCHPYTGQDPFIIKEVPDIYIVGAQERFVTKMVASNEFGEHTRCRLIGVPSFARTGVIALVNLRTLETRKVRLGVEKMTTRSVNEQTKGEDVEMEVDSSLPQSSNRSDFL
ncbi:DNA polymerase delta small subunit Cdc1 [Marasmius tenuissimus]|nr:DNA polymerase delta small subunit Cdc1 [Marasmius tenuissimus]